VVGITDGVGGVFVNGAHRGRSPFAHCFIII
jgi:hypothetical protein